MASNAFSRAPSPPTACGPTRSRARCLRDGCALRQPRGPASRVLGEPVDLRDPGAASAQLVGRSRGRAVRDPGRWETRRRARASAALGPPPGVAGGGGAAAERRQLEVHSHGIAQERAVARRRRSRVTSAPRGSPRRSPGPAPARRCRPPCPARPGWGTARAHRARSDSSRRSGRSAFVPADELGSAPAPTPMPSSSCFSECGSDSISRRRTRGTRAVAQPVVAVPLRPALVGVELLVERVAWQLGLARSTPTAGADLDEGRHPLGVVGREQRPTAPAADRGHERPLDAGRIEHRQRVATYSRRCTPRRRAGRSDRPLPRRRT